ncbi:hypothetical protein AGMMS50256_11800 [Betaproteobacteria bacterium]|nr:hypothetical protein AGMMS50256_11800 [Betaproteobacteria bacterium]
MRNGFIIKSESRPHAATGKMHPRVTGSGEIIRNNYDPIHMPPLRIAVGLAGNDGNPTLNGRHKAKMVPSA